MRKLYLFIILVLSFGLHAQTWTWSTTAQVRNGQKRICRDAANNIYLFKNYNFYSTETDTIKKITPSGSLLFQFTLPQNTQLTNLVATPDTGFYLAGTYFGTVTISNQTITGNESINIWFAKYNSAGVIQWIRTLGSDAEDQLGDICVRGNGLVLTGTLGDTTYYMGQEFPKAQQKEMFVVTIDGNGFLLALKCVTSLSTQTTQNNSTQISQGVAWGLDCEVDALGNVYILTQALGESIFDTDTLGEWATDPMYPNMEAVLLKLNSTLNLQFKHLYGICGYCSSYYDNLTVSSNGESYVAYHYSYGQSGNDIQMSSIYHVNPSGTASGTFALRPDMRAEICDMDIDQCGNLYFTGYWYSHWGPPSFYGACVVAELTPQLQVNWILNDSSQTSSPRGVGICKIGTNEYFINGYSADTIIDNQGIFPNGNQHGFFTRITGSADGGCLDDVGMAKQIMKNQALTVFPNPGSGKFSFSPPGDYSDVQVFNSIGSRVLYEKHASDEVNLKDLVPGMYFIRLNDASGNSKSARVIIAK